MAKLVYEALEPNPYNDAGNVLTLYFRGEPTPEEVKEAASPWADSVYPNHTVEKTEPTPIMAPGLTRWQCFPAD